MSRFFSRSVARLLLATLLIAQGAVAAYACPALKGAMEVAAQSRTTTMPADCVEMGRTASMDLDMPNLCLAHCQSEQQVNDHPHAPAVPAVMASVLIVALPDSKVLASSGRAVPFERVPVAASPPHTILHCCFRI